MSVEERKSETKQRRSTQISINIHRIKTHDNKSKNNKNSNILFAIYHDRWMTKEIVDDDDDDEEEDSNTRLTMYTNNKTKTTTCIHIQCAPNTIQRANERDSKQEKRKHSLNKRERN